MDSECGRVEWSRLHPECEQRGCPLPINCEHCGACLLHCAGTTGWWDALKYWYHCWVLSGGGRSQGGWTFRNWWDVLQVWPWLWEKVDRVLWPLKKRYCEWRGIPWWLG